MRRAPFLLAGAVAALCCAPAARGGTVPDVQVMAVDALEYSYSTETGAEIVENWLDASLLVNGVRAGILLNHQAPSEEGGRLNEVRHRFLEFGAGGLELRAGHFYGMFGRGLLFAAQEDRRIRIDTALDGLLVSARRGRLRGTAFTGTPGALSVDVRGLDAEADLGGGWSVGGSGLTWRADGLVEPDGDVHREWVAASRLTAARPWGGLYVEYGRKKGWDYEVVPDDEYQGGEAFYGALDLAAGPLGLSLEAKDYRRFTVLRRVDGRTPLNNPPSLTREHLFTLLNRAPHVVNADDERGQQAELTWTGGAGWSALVNASRTERHDGALLFEEIYGHVERERWGDLRLRAGFGYRDNEGLRQTVVAEATWFLGERHSLGLEVEHQHVRLGGGTGFDLGAYDEEFLKLELAAAPTWTVAGILELNNKYEEQRAFGEKAGPFPAVQLTYTTETGAYLSLWAGRRQAGYLCAGGVCKYEPAFEGVELTGTVRY
mgnify:CR=1 FL=1